MRFLCAKAELPEMFLFPDLWGSIIYTELHNSHFPPQGPLSHHLCLLVQERSLVARAAAGLRGWRWIPGTDNRLEGLREQGSVCLLYLFGGVVVGGTWKMSYRPSYRAVSNLWVCGGQMVHLDCGRRGTTARGCVIQDCANPVCQGKNSAL